MLTSSVVGGESGSSARPIREEWVDEIYDQCINTGTAFFFKQWGAWGRDNRKRSKKANGREYRGQTWDQMPTFAHSVPGTPQVKSGMDEQWSTSTLIGPTG